MDLLVPQMTFQNHYQFGFDGSPFLFRSSPNQKFWVNYGACLRTPLDWRSECQIAAQQIHDVAKSDIRLCISGGVDSEMMAESFRLARIPFRAAILRLKNDLNIHDISWAVIYCEKYDIPYDFIELDLPEFYLGGEMVTLARESQCVYPGITLTIKVLEVLSKKGFYPVTGAGDCTVVRHQGRWYLRQNEIFISLHRFQMSRNFEGATRFFHWNPEIIYSFLADPLMRKLVENKYPQFNSSFQLKSDICGQYFDLAKRPKYRGFEKFVDLNNRMSAELQKMLPYHNQIILLPYTEIVNRLSQQEAA